MDERKYSEIAAFFHNGICNYYTLAVTLGVTNATDERLLIEGVRREMNERYAVLNAKTHRTPTIALRVVSEEDECIKLKVLVPRSMVTQVFLLCHCGIFCKRVDQGHHLNRKSTENIIKEAFDWPGGWTGSLIP